MKFKSTIQDIKQNTDLQINLLLQVILFIPILVTSSIGSDWDSYAVLASGKIYITEGLYIPSRPPGFPIYEILIGALYVISIEFVLLTNFILNILFLLFVYSKLSKTTISKIIFHTIFLSSVYLVASFSIIDYILGAFFGFLAIEYLKNDRYLLASISIFISCGIRLSNLIFLIAMLYFCLMNKKELKVYLLFIFSLFLTAAIYLPSYQIGGGLCFLNLTNIDHNGIDRVGRFVYKQLQIFGIIGSMLFLYSLFTNKTKFRDFNVNDKTYLIIIILFELSFLRLPTEKGHLLPALFCLVFLSDKLFSKSLVVYCLLIFTLFSNFLTIEFLTPDTPNHATTANLNITITQGYYLQDFEQRLLKMENFDNYLQVGINNIKSDWSNGGPNC